MAAEMTRKEMFEACKRIGLHCDYYAPGDGVTRYRFWNRGERQNGKAITPEKLSYFSCHGIYTALGLSEAATFVIGYQYGWASERNK